MVVGPGSRDTKGLSKADAELYAAKQRVFASDECKEHREEYAKVLHAQNLQRATSFLHRKGVWRMRLNATCEITEVVSGVKGGPPVPGEFSFRCSTEGQMPTFGSLSRLDETQTAYAKQLIIDLEKVARARELAYQHRQASEAEGTSAQAALPIAEYLECMTAKAGTLPPGRSEVQEAQRQQEAAAVQRRDAKKAADLRAALLELGVVDDSTDGMCDGGLGDAIERDRQRERKKADKKARQKAKKEAARGVGDGALAGTRGTTAGDDDADDDEVDGGSSEIPAAVHAADAEAALDAEVFAFERLLLGQSTGVGGAGTRDARAPGLVGSRKHDERGGGGAVEVT